MPRSMAILGTALVVVWGMAHSTGRAHAGTSNLLYLAEGTTRPGFHEYVAMVNTGPAASVGLTFQPDAGAPVSEQVSLPAGSRSTVDVNQLVGPGHDVSVIVDTGSNPGLEVDRTMYFSGCFGTVCAEGSSTVAAQQPATTWDFAEGHVGEGFQEYLTIQNPGPASSATVTYIQPQGTTARTYQLPAQGRLTVNVNGEIPAGDVAIALASPSSVIAERALYFNACVPMCINGGSMVAGGQPATSWSFAEGFTGPGFRELITILNPGPQPARVAVDYAAPDGPAGSQTLTIDPDHRSTVDVNSAVKTWDVSARITSDQPVVSERVMYFDSCSTFCVFGGTVGLGRQPRADWAFGEGYTGPGFQEFLSIFNPGAGPVSVQIDYLTGSGLVAGSLVQINGGARTTVDVNQGAGAGQSVSAHLSASGPIVVGRPIYFAGCLADICVHQGLQPPPPGSPNPPQPAAQPQPTPNGSGSAPGPAPSPSNPSSPSPSPAPSGPPPPVRDSMTSAISSLVDSNSGRVGVAIREFGGGSSQSWSYHGGDWFVAGSTYKAVAMMYEAQQIAAGNADPNGQVCYQDQDATDTWYGDYQAGACFSRTELATRAGQVSDNVAGYMLVRDSGGAGPLNDFANQHGATNAQFFDPNNTTADNLAELFAAEQRGEMGGDTAKAWLYPFLTHTRFEQGIPAGVDPGIQVVHKVGFIDDYLDDAAIVFTASGKGYVIVVCTQDADDAWDTIAKVSRAAWQYEGARP